MQLLRLTLGATALLVGATLAHAQDARAVIIANGDYSTQRDVGDARDTRALAERLDTLGFEVSSLRDRNADQMRGDAVRLGRTISGADTLLIVTAGHTVGNARDSEVIGPRVRRSPRPNHRFRVVESITQRLIVIWEPSDDYSLKLIGKAWLVLRDMVIVER